MADEKKSTASPTTAPPKVDKANDDRYIFNPASNRWVLKNGITGKKLRKQMSRAEIVEHINGHASDVILKNRDLIRTDLSDDQLLDILRKLVSIKIDEGVRLTDMMPPKPPVLKRQQGIYKNAAQSPPPPPPSPKKSKRSKKAKKSKKAPKSTRRFKVLAPPEPDTTDFTEFDETTAYEQTEASDSTSSSDTE